MSVCFVGVFCTSDTIHFTIRYDIQPCLRQRKWLVEGAPFDPNGTICSHGIFHLTLKWSSAIYIWMYIRFGGGTAPHPHVWSCWSYSPMTHILPLGWSVSLAQSTRMGLERRHLNTSHFAGAHDLSANYHVQRRKNPFPYTIALKPLPDHTPACSWQDRICLS